MENLIFSQVYNTGWSKKSCDIFECSSIFVSSAQFKMLFTANSANIVTSLFKLDVKISNMYYCRNVTCQIILHRKARKYKQWTKKWHTNMWNCFKSCAGKLFKQLITAHLRDAVANMAFFLQLFARSRLFQTDYLRRHAKYFSAKDW